MLDALLQGIVEDSDENRWLVLADYLEEFDDPRRAELLRLHRQMLATSCEPQKHPQREAWQLRMVALLAEGVQPCVPRTTISLGDGIDMQFAWIPPGTFLMGSPESELERSEDETQHQVTLTKGYWLGIHPVTQAQWQVVMGDYRSRFKIHTHPVDKGSWNDSDELVKKLGKKTDKRFRLPTEAEWEYACRAGTTTPFHFGETISADNANFNAKYPYGQGKEGIYRKKTTPVGSFPANAWGLYDMHGNVLEWCSDWYGDYPKEDTKDPQGCNVGIGRVQRGGAWCDYPRSCRSAFRRNHDAGNRRDRHGCRVLLCLD